MRLRALDLETTSVLHEMLGRGLEELANRAAALAAEVAPEQGDQLGYIASDTARLADIVKILEFRSA
jgi:hypothetical protein